MMRWTTTGMVLKSRMSVGVVDDGDDGDSGNEGRHESGALPYGITDVSSEHLQRIKGIVGAVEDFASRADWQMENRVVFGCSR